jgi:hypothetical protein
MQTAATGTSTTTSMMSVGGWGIFQVGTVRAVLVGSNQVQPATSRVMGYWRRLPMPRLSTEGGVEDFLDVYLSIGFSTSASSTVGLQPGPCRDSRCGPLDVPRQLATFSVGWPSPSPQRVRTVGADVRGLSHSSDSLVTRGSQSGSPPPPAALPLLWSTATNTPSHVHRKDLRSTGSSRSGRARPERGSGRQPHCRLCPATCPAMPEDGQQRVRRNGPVPLTGALLGPSAIRFRPVDPLAGCAQCRRGNRQLQIPVRRWSDQPRTLRARPPLSCRAV